jgi:hypothetical protein
MDVLLSWAGFIVWMGKINTVRVLEVKLYLYLNLKLILSK